MAELDSPLQQLVSAFITDFAAWLLHADMREAYALNVELPGGILMADQVFRVTLADGRALVLHIEFQSRSGHQPMQWRMLEYMARLASPHHLDVWSAVFYVGRGAGLDDTGNYQLTESDDVVMLSWHYQVVRLWAMQAEELVAVGRPALLALVGQTHIEALEAFRGGCAWGKRGRFSGHHARGVVDGKHMAWPCEAWLHANSASNALASLRSAVSKPSVNQP